MCTCIPGTIRHLVMMCLPYFFIWPLLSFWWTTVLLRQLWKKRLAVLLPHTPPSPPPPPPQQLLLLLCCCSCCCCCCCAAAELLLCCCCCHIQVPLLRVTKKICCASRCQPTFPFFDTRLYKKLKNVSCEYDHVNG